MLGHPDGDVTINVPLNLDESTSNISVGKHISSFRSYEFSLAIDGLRDKLLEMEPFIRFQNQPTEPSTAKYTTNQKSLFRARDWLSNISQLETSIS